MDFRPARIIRAVAERRLQAVTCFHNREQNAGSSTSASGFGRWAPVPLRLIVGYAFMFHGYAKLVRGPEHFVEILHALGVPVPGLMGWIIIIVELVGGLAILMGAFERWVSIHCPRYCLFPCFRCCYPMASHRSSSSQSPVLGFNWANRATKSTSCIWRASRR